MSPHHYQGWNSLQRQRRRARRKAMAKTWIVNGALVILAYVAIMVLGGVIAAFTPGGGHGF